MALLPGDLRRKNPYLRAAGRPFPLLDAVENIPRTFPILLHADAVSGSVVAIMSVPNSRRAEITSALKRCSAQTIEAALRFQETRNPADVSAVVYGILERELPEEAAGTLANAPGTSRLVEDIGLDSLGLMEAVMSVEEVLGITIDNSELRKVATLEDLNGFIRQKLDIAA